MSEYKKQLQQIVKEYRQNGQTWPASASGIAFLTLKNHGYDIATPTIQRISSRDLAQTIREESITDHKDRRVRAKHPVKVNCDG